MVQDIDSIVEQFLLRSQRSASCEHRHHARVLYVDKACFPDGGISSSDLQMFDIGMLQKSGRQLADQFSSLPNPVY